MTDARTILLFGELDDAARPRTVLAHFGAEAYEHHMVAPYARELLMVRKTDYICWSPGFDQIYVAACALGGGGRVWFEELGSTLYSTIDKLEKLDALNGRRMGASALRFAGIEVSLLLIDLAEALHPTTSLVHRGRWQELPVTDRAILSRSYQSTSYAFDSTDDLFAWITRARYGIHGVWWSLSGSTQAVRGAGNRITLFDPERFSALSRKSGLRINVIKSETFDLGADRFSASWIVVDGLSSEQRTTMTRLREDLHMPELPAVCDLTTSDLRARPHMGKHAGFASIDTGRPLDFANDALLARWRAFIGETSVSGQG